MQYVLKYLSEDFVQEYCSVCLQLPITNQICYILQTFCQYLCGRAWEKHFNFGEINFNDEKYCFRVAFGASSSVKGKEIGQ